VHPNGWILGDFREFPTPKRKSAPQSKARLPASDANRWDASSDRNDILEDINMTSTPNTPLFQKIDCIRLHVSDLNAALDFYRDQLGHRLIWRTEGAIGLGMPDSDAEIVLYTEEGGEEIDFLVNSAEEAALRFVEAGGKVIVSLFDIQIGRCAVVQDPWGNKLVLLDSSKGRLLTDSNGNVIGNVKA
jgi:catechol 2,3-dioxygenase-like lactoylglutathione lyase family enzyme